MPLTTVTALSLVNGEKFEGTIYLNQGRDDDYWFTGMNLNHASFEDSILRGCTFSGNQMKKLKAQNAIFAGCSFHGDIGCVLQEAELQNTTFHYCGFLNTRFPLANLQGAVFNNSNFVGDYLRNGLAWHPFFGANLAGVKFLHCDLSQTGITREQLEVCASIEGSKLPIVLERERGEIEEAIAQKTGIPTPASVQQARKFANLKKIFEKRSVFEAPEEDFSRTIK